MLFLYLYFKSKLLHYFKETELDVKSNTVYDNYFNKLKFIKLFKSNLNYRVTANLK